jgi:glycine hydroxymethyltransferase
VVTGGTDNHTVLVDATHAGLTGAAAETALEQYGIIVNKNRIPGDTWPAEVTSGIRIGTSTAAWRGWTRPDAATCAQLIHTVLTAAEGQSDRRAAVPATVFVA